MTTEGKFRKNFLITLLDKINVQLSPTSYSNLKYRERKLLTQLTPKEYIRIFEDAGSRTTCYTTTLIQPELLGVSLRKVQSKYGRSVCKLKFEDFTIAKYQVPMMGTTASCKVHAFHNKTFLIELDFKELSLAKLYELLKLATVKYGCEIDMDKNAIVDNNGNRVFFTYTIFGSRFSYMADVNANGVHQSILNKLAQQPLSYLEKKNEAEFRLQRLV